MSNIKDAINEINKDYNFPGLAKLIKLVQSKYPFSKDEIIKAVKGDVNTQLMIPRTSPKVQGNITSLAPNELMQLDIFDMQKYKKDNIEYEELIDNSEFAILDEFVFERTTEE